jgi:hypothetical protein
MIFCLVGCATTQYVPTTTIDRIVYRDTTIVINDTIMVPIEKEVIKEVIPELDTSYLETSVAKSVAYLDTAKRQLRHTLTQEGKVEYIVDTFYTTTYVDRYIEKPVIQEVEVIRYKRDNLFWISIIFNVIVLCFLICWIYLKLR